MRFRLAGISIAVLLAEDEHIVSDNTRNRAKESPESLYVPTARLSEGEQLAEARLLLEMAGEFRMREQPDQARRYARRALVIFERVWGPDHLDSVTALVAGAEARQDSGDNEHAKSEYVQASEILDDIADDFEPVHVLALRIRVIRGIARAVYAAGRHRDSERILID